MSDEIEQDVARLRERAEELRLVQQRAEAQLEAARAEEQRLLGRMREEFGVSTLDEARALLEKLDAELVSEMAAVREALEQTRPELS